MEIIMKKKIISAILSVSIIITSYAAVFAKPLDIPYSERPLTADIEGINSAINTLKEDLKKPNNKDKVFEDYYALLDIASKNGDTHQINYLELEKLNYDIPTSYSREFVNENIDNTVKYGNDIKMAVKSILDSRYSNDFKEYWGEERTEHIAQMRDNTEEVKEGKQFYDRYFELIDKNADSLEFAKLLNELIKKSSSQVQETTDFDNYLDFLYDSNKTGFNTEQVLKYCMDITEDYYYYVNKFKNYGTHFGFDSIDESITIENPLESLAYVKKIDPKISASYDYLVKNGLFFLGSTEKERGATAPMRFYGDAGIIVSGNDPMRVLIHEFGHYQSFLNTEISSEDLFFGEQYEADLQEFNSQAFELISTDCYEDIYGENAQGKKFRTIVTLMQQMSNLSALAMTETALYSPKFAGISDEELNEILKMSLGEKWYLSTPQFFTSQGNYINYSLMLFNALQIYDTYLHDKTAGINKYLEACSYKNGSYTELTEKLGLKSAFDEDAGDYLNEITNDIFKTEYNLDYETALDYFENGTYLGKVKPTSQRVSVNGGAAQTLYAYNSSDFNYIRIRDLAALLSGTEQQFDVEYDTENYTVNIITGRPYTSDGTEMREIEEIKTAGQKSSGTFTLMRDGEPVQPGGAMFINGWNCYLLRGLAEKGVLDLDIDYDAENDIVLISTK